MHIDIWSDVVCPWCYIGKRRFEQALESLDTPGGATVVHRSFQLDPSRPLGQTQNRRQMLMAKYRLSAQQIEAMDAQMEQLATADGLEFHLRPEGVTGNTRHAHELIHLGRARGIGDAVVERFFKAYFTEGRSVFDTDSLLTLAGKRGSIRRRPARRSTRAPTRRPWPRRASRLGTWARTAYRFSSSTRATASRARSRSRCFATRSPAQARPRRRKPDAPDGSGGRYLVSAGRWASALRVVSSVNVSDSRGMLVTKGPTSQPTPNGMVRVSEIASHWR